MGINLRKFFGHHQRTVVLPHCLGM
jgi:hypothetical protein